MSDITVSYEDTKKVIAKLNNGAAMGPDGLLVQVYKYGGHFVLEAIMDIAQCSVKTGVNAGSWPSDSDLFFIL